MKRRGMVSAARFGRRRGGLKIFHKIRVCPSGICCKMLKIMYNQFMRGNGYGVISKVLKMKNFAIGFLVFSAWVLLLLASFDVFTK